MRAVPARRECGTAKRSSDVRLKNKNTKRSGPQRQRVAQLSARSVWFVRPRQNRLFSVASIPIAVSLASFTSALSLRFAYAAQAPPLCACSAKHSRTAAVDVMSPTKRASAVPLSRGTRVYCATARRNGLESVESQERVRQRSFSQSGIAVELVGFWVLRARRGAIAHCLHPAWRTRAQSARV